MTKAALAVEAARNTATTRNVRSPGWKRKKMPWRSAIPLSQTLFVAEMAAMALRETKKRAEAQAEQAAG